MKQCGEGISFPPQKATTACYPNH